MADPLELEEFDEDGIYIGKDHGSSGSADQGKINDHFKPLCKPKEHCQKEEDFLC